MERGRASHKVLSFSELPLRKDISYEPCHRHASCHSMSNTHSGSMHVSTLTHTHTQFQLLGGWGGPYPNLLPTTSSATTITAHIRPPSKTAPQEMSTGDEVPLPLAHPGHQRHGGRGCQEF